jgi:hypothetical protein
MLTIESAHMFDPAAHIITPHATPRDEAFRNLAILSYALRFILAAYTAHSLFRFAPWWFHPNNVAHLDDWQQVLGLSVNLIPWCLLLMTTALALSFLDKFQKNRTFTFHGGVQLMRCAWLACGCQICTMLARPVTQSILNQSLSVEFNPLNWSFSQRDPIAMMLCMVLLMLAYVHRWMLIITQENEAFI